MSAYLTCIHDTKSPIAQSSKVEFSVLTKCVFCVLSFCQGESGDQGKKGIPGLIVRTREVMCF